VIEQRLQQPASGCDAVREQLPAYALGAIDYVDRDLIETHLRVYDDCRIEAARLSTVASLLPLALPVADTPHPASWSAILDRVRSDEDVTATMLREPMVAVPATSPSLQSPPTPTWTRFLPAALIAPLAVALVVVGTWATSLYSNTTASDPTDINIVPQMLNDSSVRTYAVERSCADCQGTGQLGLSNTSQLGMMVAWDFDPMEDHMVWGISSTGEVIRVCELYVDPTGTVMQTFMLPNDPASIREIYITDENGSLIYVAHLQPVTSDPPTVPVTIN